LNSLRNEIEHNESIIREREEDFQNIESQIVDINTIFRELHYMVNEQGEHLDLIETQIEDAHLKVQVGNQNLTTANNLDKKGRNVMCLILIIVLGIAAAITILLVVLKSLNIF
jgi:t-SNARE complex subunit (syntaxin)